MNRVASFKESGVSIYKIFKKHTAGQRNRIILALSLALINQLMSLSVPLTSKFIIDVIIVKGYINYIAYAISLGIFLLLIMLFSLLGSNYLMFKISGVSGIRLKMDFFKTLQFAEIDFLKRIDKGSISHRTLSDTEQITSFWMQTLTSIPSIVFLICSFSLMIYYHAYLAFLIIGLLLLDSLIVVGFYKKIFTFSFILKEKAQDITQFIVKHFSKIVLIRTFSAEKKEQIVFLKRLKEKYKANLNLFMINKSSVALESFISNLWVFFVLWYGSWLIAEKQLTVGGLVAFLLMAGVLTPHVKVLMKLILTYQDVRTSLHRVLEFQAVKPYLTKEVDMKPCLVETGKIEFVNVAFAYSENQILMQPSSFAISPYKITAITGASGSGKSTLAKLMIRLLSPKEGAILIDGRNIKTMTLKSLRENIHLTQQNNYIFDGTILENLTYRVKNKNKKEVLKAIKRSGIDFINELPNGLNTVVGENSLNISGGEAQKITFARALLKKPKVYIFDEITSSLDVESEGIILKTISQLKQEATVIMICHKSSTLEIADEIISLEDGILKHDVMGKKVMVS